MTLIAEDPIERVIMGLSPFLGRSIAQASVRGHVTKLGIVGRPSDDELGNLLLALTPGLNVFLGRIKAGAVISSLRKSLDLPG